MSDVRAETERRSELYGPGRCLAREAAKKVLQQDHIKPNFQSGVNRQHSNQLFQTTTTDHFKVSGLYHNQRNRSFSIYFIV